MLVCVVYRPPLCCGLLPRSEAEIAGTLDWADPRGVDLGTSGIKAYGRAKLQVGTGQAHAQRHMLSALHGVVV